MRVEEISIETFTEFVNNYNYSSVLQTNEYGLVMKNQGFNPIYIGIYNNDNLVGVSLILINKERGYKYGYAPRGFLMDYTNKDLLINFTKELKKFLNKKDVIAIKICPPIIREILDDAGTAIGVNPKFNLCFENLKEAGYHHYGFNSLFEAYKPRFEALIDLTLNEEELFSNIKKNYRTKINGAIKEGIKVYRANSSEIDLIYQQTKNKYPRDLKYFQDSYNIFTENKKMEYYYAKLDTDTYLKYIKKGYEKAESLVNELNKELLATEKDKNEKLLSKKMDADYKLSIFSKYLVEANALASKYQNGLVLASMLIAKNGPEIYLYMDGFDTQHKRFNGKHLLMWKIMEKYSKLGYKRFNLGGITDIRVDNKKYHGLNEFKLNFNSSVVEYIGDFELVVNQAKYFLFRQRNKK